MQEILINILRVPRRYLEMIYSILLPGGYTSNQPPTAHEFLTVLAFMKGFMASSGIPDCSRAGRLVLNDVQTGKLKYVTAPPVILVIHQLKVILCFLGNIPEYF
jgi:ribosome biogenesis GTPase A